MFNIPLEGMFGSITVDLYEQMALLTIYMGSLEGGYSPQKDSSPGNDYILDERSGLTSLTGQEVVMPTDIEAIRCLKRGAVAKAMIELNKIERLVLTSHFGLDGEPTKTLKEIGAEQELTGESIRQIKAKAFAILRRSPRSRHLRDFIYNQ